jgi:hypothetical protein
MTKTQRNHLVQNIFGALSTYHYENKGGLFCRLLLQNILATANDFVWKILGEEEIEPPYWRSYSPSDEWDKQLLFQVHIRRFVYAHSHGDLAETIDKESKFFMWCALFRSMASLNRIHKDGRGVFARRVNLGCNVDANDVDQLGWLANPSVKLTLQFLRNYFQQCTIYEHIVCNDRRAKYAFPHMVFMTRHLLKLAGLAPLPQTFLETDAIRLGNRWWDEIRQDRSDYKTMVESMAADRPTYHSGRSIHRVPRYNPTQTNELLPVQTISRQYLTQFLDCGDEGDRAPGWVGSDGVPDANRVIYHEVVRRR